MSKKSLLYIGAGALMILAAVLSLITGAIISAGWIIERRGLFNVLFDSDLAGMYFRNLTTLAWLEFAAMIVVGALLVAKGLLPDMIPDIGLVGGFGLLTLFVFFKVADNLFYAIDGGYFDYIWLYIVFDSVVMLGYACMAGLILMKGSLNMFFFVPAFLILTNATTWFFTRWFGMFEVSFIHNLLCYAMDWVLVIALVAAGLANNEA